MTRRILSLFFAAATFTTAYAEDFPCKDLQVRVSKQPLYPPIAAAAHFSGKIELTLRLDANAKVLSVDTFRDRRYYGEPLRTSFLRGA